MPAPLTTLPCSYNLRTEGPMPCMQPRAVSGHLGSSGTPSLHPLLCELCCLCIWVMFTVLCLPLQTSPSTHSLTVYGHAS